MKSQCGAVSTKPAAVAAPTATVAGRPRPDRTARNQATNTAHAQGKRKYTAWYFVKSAPVQQMMAKVERVLDPDIEAKGWEKIRSTVEVDLVDGRMLVDALRRATRTFVLGTDIANSDPRTTAAEVLIGNITYGEGQPAALNARTRIFQQTDTAGIVTVEDHRVVGGLASAVAEVTAARQPCRVIPVAVPFGGQARGRVGNHRELLEAAGVRTEAVIEGARALVHSEQVAAAG